MGRREERREGEEFKVLAKTAVYYVATHRVVVKMVKTNLCLSRGSKSFLLKIAGLAEERTPTSRSGKESKEHGP